jgi:N-ethylmaleimide reductase
MSESILFSQFPVGGLRLKNRVVMAPMTRSRAIGNIPNELMARYYAQRAEAGLIVTEGTSPSPNGLGYARIPGIFNSEQVREWKRVTDAVHEAGGRIFVQLMHTGRVSHPANMPEGARVLAPSAIQLEGQMYTDSAGPQPHPVPQAMSEAEIESAIEEFVSASRLAIQAGFDGVELHGANGYLIDQFLNLASNRRQDQWGGSVAGRIRFSVEIARRASLAIGAERVGMRVSPLGTFNGLAPDPEMEMLYAELARELGNLGIAYLHVIGPGPEGKGISQKIRENFRGPLILAGGYDRGRAESDLLEKRGDLVAFGRPFISNPQLVTKLREGRPLSQPDSATFFTPGEVGYTDYA